MVFGVLKQAASVVSVWRLHGHSSKGHSRPLLKGERGIALTPLNPRHEAEGLDRQQGAKLSISRHRATRKYRVVHLNRRRFAAVALRVG